MGRFIMMLKPLTKEYAEIVIEKFLNLYSDYDIQRCLISVNEMVVVIADALVLYIKYDVECDFMGEFNREQYLRDGVCGIDIEELTFNALMPQYKHGPFLNEIQETLGVYTAFVRYARFRGVNANYLSNGIFTHREYVIEKCPEVRLQERLAAWVGNPYTIVIFEMKALDGHVSYAADAIKGDVHSLVLRFADNLMHNNYYYNRKLDGSGLSEANKFVDDDFVESVLSHKGVRKIKRFEENLMYYSFPVQYFRTESAVRDAVRERIEEAKAGKYNSIEKIPYSKPEYKWKTEEYIYKIIKKHYKDYGVIYQHRPLFLHSSFGGQMSYDVYISKFKIAVEYQGQQHFEPVDFFGGEEAFEKVKLRDEEKRKLSEENGIKLVYFNYWEDITPELVCERINAKIILEDIESTDLS